MMPLNLRGLFGAPVQGEQPPFGGPSTLPVQAGNGAAPQGADTSDHPMALPTYHPAKRNLSQNLGLLADAFRNNNDNGDRYAQLDQQKYNTWNAQAQAQLQRAAQYAQFKAEQQYKAANPQPTELSQRIKDLNAFKPGLGDTYASNYAVNGGGMPQMITTAQGTFMVPRNASPAPSGPQPGAIVDGHRFKGGNPNDQNSWEALAPSGVAPLTSGTAAPILSGASSSQVISAADAAHVRASLGPNGGAAFQKWLVDHNITVGN